MMIEGSAGRVQLASISHRDRLVPKALSSLHHGPVTVTALVSETKQTRPAMRWERRQNGEKERGEKAQVHERWTKRRGGERGRERTCTRWNMHMWTPRAARARPTHPVVWGRALLRSIAAAACISRATCRWSLHVESANEARAEAAEDETWQFPNPTVGTQPVSVQ